MRILSKIRETKVIFKPLFAQLSATPDNQDEYAEAAFHAYAHNNPLIDFLFWERLRTVESYLLSKGVRKVLDFGCGSGIMSYCLSLSGIQTIGTDTETLPLKEVLKHVTFPKQFTFVEPRQLSSSHEADFDAVIALDVLEHTSDPLKEIEGLAKYLKPDGEIIVCGPTENILYKVGRRLSGKEFTGAYHKTNIVDIRKVAETKYKVTHIKTLYPFIPLFEIFKISA